MDQYLNKMPELVATPANNTPAMDGDRTGPDPENKIKDDEIPQNYDPNGKTDNPFINIDTENPDDSGAGKSGDGSLLNQNSGKGFGRNVLGGGADADFIAGTQDEIN